jgi:adenine-specific DNA glycosylase
VDRSRDVWSVEDLRETDDDSARIDAELSRWYARAGRDLVWEG